MAAAAATASLNPQLLSGHRRHPTSDLREADATSIPRRRRHYAGRCDVNLRSNATARRFSPPGVAHRCPNGQLRRQLMPSSSRDPDLGGLPPRDSRRQGSTIKKEAKDRGRALFHDGLSLLALSSP